MASLRIRPGLERITRLLKNIDLSWKAVHVAGTNGKGSTCAFISAMLHGCNVKTGRFTSPHLLDRWDCITINDEPVSERLFREVENMFKKRNEAEAIEATPFELLTATAFEVFNREKVEVGVVECGMGGRLDSTNVFEKPLVTVITQLGMDHQAFLGNTEGEIAFEKAGIMKSGVPCVVNSFSAEPFLQTLVQQAAQKKAHLDFIPLDKPARVRKSVPTPGLESEYEELFKDMPYVPINAQKSNMWCAWRAFQIIEKSLPLSNVDHEKTIQIMAQTRMPGRFQTVSLYNLTKRTLPIIVDGAHNPEAWRAAKSWYQTAPSAGYSDRIVWVVACSKGRDPMSLFQDAIGPRDVVIVTEFGPVDGMPWVQPTPASEFEPIKQGNPQWKSMGRELREALKRACQIAGSGPIVISGSLYLAADVLRLVRDADRRNLEKDALSVESNQAGSSRAMERYGWKKTSRGTIRLNLSDSENEAGSKPTTVNNGAESNAKP